MKTTITAALILAASAAAAMPANDLGALLAAEEVCGLDYDRTAIEHWIEKNVAADDLGFAASLATFRSGHKRQFDQMTESDRTALCAQTGRVAKSLGLITD